MFHAQNTTQLQGGKQTLFTLMKNNIGDAGTIFFAGMLSSSLMLILFVNSPVLLTYLNSIVVSCLIATITIIALLILVFTAQKMNGIIQTLSDKALIWNLFLVFNFLFPLSVFLSTIKFLDKLCFVP